MMAAVITRRKVFAINARHLMSVVVNNIVNNVIDAGIGNLVARLENIPNVCHGIPPGSPFCYWKMGLSKG
jgi:hypothetical protein